MHPSALIGVVMFLSLLNCDHLSSDAFRSCESIIPEPWAHGHCLFMWRLIRELSHLLVGPTTTFLTNAEAACSVVRFPDVPDSRTQYCGSLYAVLW